MSEKPRIACPCTQNIQDTLRATNPKKDLLKKVTCKKCGRTFWTNIEPDLCLDCSKSIAKTRSNTS